jgi:hypothetical protein
MSWADDGQPRFVKPNFAGRLGSVTQLTFAAILGAVASLAAEPGFIPRGAVLFGVFSLPGLVGLLGTSARRPALLLAAGVTSTLGSFIAFSGVSLIFLMPALLMLAGAISIAATGRERSSAFEGFGQLVAASAIVALIVGAGASALLVTDEGCWNVYETPVGVRIERFPYSTGEMTIPEGARSSGCSTGLLSLRGVGSGIVLGGAAVLLAARAARRRGDPPARQVTAAAT